ncbi:uncharacterized protein LOC126669557 [Mercurialis annua]|uniref:uncharacterized protein LOC126669557 n=1 Tax=Mercurialis annua TaxID=3986 RepID=UPI002160B873|nr:uncharacterized protein LOC126669557 [Mercurialis annua]
MSGDRFFWLLKENFTVASVAGLLRVNSVHEQASISFLTQQIWKEILPPRIQFFFWLLARDRISYNMTLVRRGILDSEHSFCTFCLDEESSLHIVLHCNFAWSFWSLILANCSVIWVTPYSLKDLFVHWTSLSSGRHCNLWKLIWFFGVWHLWKNQNNRVFNDVSATVHSLVFLSIWKAVDFYRARNQIFAHSGNDVFRCIDFFCNNL